MKAPSACPLPAARRRLTGLSPGEPSGAATSVLPLLCAVMLAAALSACAGGAGSADEDTEGDTSGDVINDADTGEDTGAGDAESDADADPCDVSTDGENVFVPGCGEPNCETGCDDGNPCTEDICDEDIGCVHELIDGCCTDDQCDIDGDCYDHQQADPLQPCQVCNVAVDPGAWTLNDSATCDDGDSCTTNDACRAGVCLGIALYCDDENECTDDACEAGACVQTNNTATCDDGDLCTGGDVCSGGSCVGTTQTVCNDGNLCTADSCDPATGCVFNGPAANDIECDDQDSCTIGDACTDGACVGLPGACDDGNACTADYCNATGCGAIPIDAFCFDTNPCTDELCDPDEGCVFPFNTNSCNDGDLCTEADTCTEGACLGTPIDVDDNNPCTDDRCVPGIGPLHVNNGLSCDDGDACTIGDRCVAGTCVTGVDEPICDDRNSCTTDYCDSDLGCVNEANTFSCDDMNACTAGDSCMDGDCLGATINCDDGRACTEDGCDATFGCTHTVLSTNSCRPQIEVDFPLRAATIESNNLPPVVIVTGRLNSGGGPIVSFKINGAEVPIVPVLGSEWNYTFAYPYAATVGHNTLEMVAIDDLGTRKQRIQSFHWSRDYQNGPNVDPGMVLYLAQQTIDDRLTPPPSDLAMIFQTVIDGYDLGALLGTSDPIASEAGYDIYVRSIGYSSSDVRLDAFDGGLLVGLVLEGINGRLYFDCNGFKCGVAGGSGGGGITADSITVTAELLISTNSQGEVVIRVGDANTSILGMDVYADNGWTNIILGAVELVIRDDLVSSLESSLTGELTNILGPTLASAFSGLALNLDVNLPRLDGSGEIPIALASNFSGIDFEDSVPGPPGGTFNLKAWASTNERAVATGYPFDDNLGVPLRDGCGTPPQITVIPKITPLELVLTDDLLNAILRAAWWGGLMDFPVDESLLGGLDLTEFGVNDLEMNVSAWLPPLASDCRDGELKLYLGDLRIDAHMNLFGQDIDIIGYVAFEAPLSLASRNGAIQITIESIENVRMDLEVQQENLINSELVIRDLLEAQLIPSLGDLLGGGEPIAEFPLPEIDISEDLGVAPGTLVIAIEPETNPGFNTHIDGNTIVYGRLR